MKKEYCGLFGIYGHKDAARMTYFGLYALQHRGQESAGIVTYDGQKTFEHKGMGLVPDVFKEEDLKHLPGHIAIGHVRYSTTGSSQLRNAQPFLVHFKDMQIAIGHNGNLINTWELRQELENEGIIFQTTMDSEIIIHLLAKYLNQYSLEEAIAKALAKVQGAYSLLILANNKLIAIRDPFGFRPLSIGKMGSSYVLASETCAFDLLEAEFLRCVNPGEMIIIENDRLRRVQLAEPQKSAYCAFELIYFARPDSIIFNQSVYLARKKMGQILAQEAPVEADFVMPFPDSGVYAAIGYAQTSHIPFEVAMIRNHYVGRTFIQPSQDMRDFGVRIKLNPVANMIKNKKIIIVEDSIVRGTTIRTRVKKLRELGAREIHMRVSCPPVRYPCFFGIDFSSKGELIASSQNVHEIAKFIGLDSLHYLSLDGLKQAINWNDDFCLACFNEDYPIVPGKNCGKFCVEW
ncbi:MAG: amidophosphoribosyltransferase [Desulfonauticus sp.]|nr:amidophosphoribosyltransferase [Desulfonauticus sp.]